MDFDVELLEITKENLEEAQFMASTFIDEEVKNRVFLNVVGAECVANHLKKFDIDVSNLHSIHSIKRVVEKIDISDIILDNIRIDVRVVFDKNLIFVPKSHFEYRVDPDIYVVIKCDKNMTRATLYGFFESSEINVKNHNESYYFIEPHNLRSPFELNDYILNFKDNTNKKLSSEQMLRGQELSVAVSDHDVTKDEFKEFLGLLMSSNELRGSVLEFDNFETLASKVAYALQIKKPKNLEDTSVVGVSDFINLEQAGGESTSEDNSSKQNDNNYNNETDFDKTVVEDDISEGSEENGLNSDNSLSENIVNEVIPEAIENTSEQVEAIASEGENTIPDINLTDADMQNFDIEDQSSEDTILPEANNNNEDVSDDNLFEAENLDLDFSDSDLDFKDFETDISEQAAQDFIDDDNNTPSAIDNSDNADFEISEDKSENIEDIIKEDIDTNVDRDYNNIENLAETKDDSKFDFTDYRNQDNAIAVDSADSDIITEEENVHDIGELESNNQTNELNELDEDPSDLYEFSQATSGFATASEAVELTSDANDIKEQVSSEFVPISSNNYDDLNENEITEFEITEDPNFEKNQEIESDEENEADSQESEIVQDAIKAENPNSETEFELQDTNFNIEDINFDKDNNLSEDNNSVTNTGLADADFGMVDDFESFESISQPKENAEVEFPDNETANVNELLNKNVPSENSIVITDKNIKPGEILIDINVANLNSQMYSENAHLEELYSNPTFNADSGLNNDTRIVSSQTKSIPLAAGIGGIAVVFIIVSIVLFSLYKFINPTEQEVKKPVIADKEIKNNLGSDVPNLTQVDDKDVVMNDNPTTVKRNSGDRIQKDMTKASAQSSSGYKHASTAFISVKKLSWEVPDYISYDSNFKQYFQSSGKSLKAALTSDLLLANDYTYSDIVKVSILFDRSGAFQGAKILSSSGSNQIDDIVLQSVNQTLKVLKAPNSLGNDQSTTVILKIYL